MAKRHMIDSGGQEDWLRQTWFGPKTLAAFKKDLEKRKPGADLHTELRALVAKPIYRYLPVKMHAEITQELEKS